jgi:hypothetical protein
MSSDEEKRDVSPNRLNQRLESRFPGEPLTDAIGAVIGSAEYEEWRLIRHVLIHRVSIARHHELRLGSADAGRTSRWGEIELNEALTAGRRGWLMSQLALLLGHAGGFSANLERQPPSDPEAALS